MTSPSLPERKFRLQKVKFSTDSAHLQRFYTRKYYGMTALRQSKGLFWAGFDKIILPWAIYKFLRIGKYDLFQIWGLSIPSERLSFQKSRKSLDLDYCYSIYSADSSTWLTELFMSALRQSTQMCMSEEDSLRPPPFRRDMRGEWCRGGEDPFSIVPASTLLVFVSWRLTGLLGDCVWWPWLCVCGRVCVGGIVCEVLCTQLEKQLPITVYIHVRTRV